MLTKITLLGDMMCEPLMLKAAKRGNAYCFDEVFENIRELLNESDCVIGNLETPLAGEEAGYTKSLFSFNTPDAFADAVKNAGVDMVLTANNHCLDRGVDGLVRTARILKEKDLPFAGTCETPDERKEAACLDVNGLKLAVVSYTYGTNYYANRIKLEGERQHLVNLLRPQNELYYVPKKSAPLPFHKRAVNRILREIPEEKRYYVKKFLGMAVNAAHADDSLKKETAEPYLAQMREDLTAAREKADLVLFCPHVGGQFNSEPGAFSEYVFEQAAACGCDAIVASHAHVALKAETVNGIPCFYSLGNFSMSPNSVYLLHENLPDYGLAVHLYVEGKKIRKTTFSVLKITEEKGKMLTVWPADRYHAQCSEKQKREVERHIQQIYYTVTGGQLTDGIVQHEYLLG